MYFCAAIIAFLLLKKSTSMSSRPASTRATSSASMPAGLMSNGLPPSISASHTRSGVAGGHPDLVAEIAGVAGAGDVDADAGDRAARDAEVLQPVDVGLRDRAQQPRGRRPLQRERRDLLRDVLDRRRSCRRRSGGTTAGSDPRPSSGTSAPPAATPSRRRSPCRARRTTACRTPGPTAIFETSRVISRSTNRAASRPVTGT